MGTAGPSGMQVTPGSINTGGMGIPGETITPDASPTPQDLGALV
jgi:hypothetical protein